MLAILPESATRTRRSPAAMAWSFTLHLVLAMLVTIVSGLEDELEPSPRPTSLDTIIFFPVVRPRPDDGSTGAGRTTREAERGSVSPALPAPVEPRFPLLPPNLAAPHVEPVFGEPDTDARRKLGADRTRAGRDGAVPDLHGAPWTPVERAAVLLPGNPLPRYPDVLRVAGIEGTVTLDFVVDTLGVIEPGSIGLVHSDHQRFTASVLDLLPQLRFAPAQAAGKRVRQAVRIPFHFRLAPRSR